ncbi:MAG: UDP-N-acetylmuramate--L-alanine ligase [Actinobacteria bacterium]|nr:UDP-N-acetylmuramate--L-alanine ligase [Actinomycetota bacterium]MCI0543413.1 UDP-N-acetylmuramate--L-alanine ligase [Actinomycetota bacterium]MCI0679326.1 UDP-N-acetylmuramate--L-alanine ligase [Actinomycetota bacterium]
MRLDYHGVHIVGAGGAGMSALAKILVGLGHRVTGSDLRGGGALDVLGDLGVVVATGHAPGLATNADLVVASSAVPDYDEELVAARGAGVPVWRRPQLLEALSAQTTTIGATGTHGKTTTTGLLITALRGMGADPSFVVGGDLVGLQTNGHLGADDLLVVEADEAFRTFESIHLSGLVVTNVEVDHLDHFGDEQAMLDSFIGVAASVDGPVLACADDPGARLVASEAGTLTYGLAADADWSVVALEVTPVSSVFTLTGPRGSIDARVPRPGRHVALDAAGALALLAELGHDPLLLGGSLAAFRGVGRRWEHRGTVAGVVLYDDYAHHPTEVRATLEAARALGARRLWAVFQPHLYSRTERFSEEFGAALATADVVVVTDVYGAREEPVPGITGELVADAAAASGKTVHYVPHRADLAAFLAPRLDVGDLVVSMGAGDITLLHGELAGLLGTPA